VYSSFLPGSYWFLVVYNADSAKTRAIMQYSSYAGDIEGTQVELMAQYSTFAAGGITLGSRSSVEFSGYLSNYTFGLSGYSNTVRIYAPGWTMEDTSTGYNGLSAQNGSHNNIFISALTAMDLLPLGIALENMSYTKIELVGNINVVDIVNPAIQLYRGGQFGVETHNMMFDRATYNGAANVNVGPVAGIINATTQLANAFVPDASTFNLYHKSDAPH
jgi:hypothetical protein